MDRTVVHRRSDEQIELARTIAADSLILLKNDGVLPLAAPASIAVIGPNAASSRNLLGDYSYLAHVESLNEVLKSGRNVFSMPLQHGLDVDARTDLSHVTTVLDEIAARLPTATIHHVEGLFGRR